MKRIGYRLALPALVALLALQTVATQAYSVSGWSRLYEGIQYATGYAASPRLMRAYALRVSLKNPDISLYTTPSNGGLPYEVTRQTTPSFVSSTGCLAGVNANYFIMEYSPYTNIQGLSISNGTVVSPSEAPFIALMNFTYDKTPSLYYSYDTPTGVWNAVAGGEIHLQNGSNISGDLSIEPRTSYGLSQDMKYLIMVCVDGRQPGYSMGATFPEMSQWLLDFGAWWGVQMDGGGSTCMAIAGYGVMNSPSGGTPRAVGNNLGVVSVANGTVGPNTARMSGTRFDMVYRGNLNHVMLKSWTYPEGWYAPIDLIGDTNVPPAVVSRGQGILDVFERCTSNNRLYQRHFENGVWSAWIDLGGDLRSGPSVCSLNANHWCVVYRTGSNTIGYLQWNNGTYTYGDVGGDTVDDPAICARGTDTMCLFERCTNNQMYQKNCVNGTWGSWVGLGGTLTSAPAVASRNANNLEIFYRGANYNLWFLRWDNGVWTYGDLGGPAISSKPSVVSLDTNAVKVHVRDTNDHLLEENWTTGGGWSGYTYCGAYF